MLSLVRSGLLRMIALLTIFLPLSILGAQIWALAPHQSHRAVTLVFSFVKPTQSSGQSVQSPRQPTLPRFLPPVIRSVLPGTSVVGGPSLSPGFINQTLASASSPAAGTGQDLYDLSKQYHIDDAYALAVFEKESSFGKYGAGFEDHALGNIVCAGYPTCNGRCRSYASWSAGYADFYQLITTEYVARGLSTVETITPVYAPSSENDTGLYIQQVRKEMLAFRQAQSRMP